MDTINKNNNTGHTRGASSSSYLSRSGGNNVLEPPSLNLSRKADQEGEISVFGAERYFSMMLEDDSPRVLVDYNNNTGRGDQHQLKPSRSSSRPATPSTCSEASWTSQSAFLSSHRRNPSQNKKKKKKVNGKRIFSSFTCNGSCSDKKSIYVHEINVGRGGPPGKDLKKQSFGTDHNPVKQSQPRFEAKEHELLHQYSSFPRSLHREENLAFANFAVKEEKKAKEEEPRNSLEVFGSSRMKRGSDLLEINLERRLSMLSWDAIPQAQTLSVTSGDGPLINEDVESDASSDLFEIENLAGTGQPTLFAEQACDGMSMASTTRYEPSEASIDWSVVTAAVSDFDEKTLVAENGRTPWNLHKDQLSHQSLGKVHDLKQR